MNVAMTRCGWAGHGYFLSANPTSCSLSLLLCIYTSMSPVRGKLIVTEIRNTAQATGYCSTNTRMPKIPRKKEPESVLIHRLDTR